MPTAVAQEVARYAARLDELQTNTEGFAWATKAAGDLLACGNELASYTFDFAAQDLAARCYGATAEIQKYGSALAALDDGPLSLPTWKPVRAAILGGYALVFAVGQELPPGDRVTWEKFLAETIVEAVKAIPKVIQGAVDAAGDIPRKVFWELFKDIAPILVGVGLLIGGAVYLALRADGAVAQSKGPIGKLARGGA